MPVVDLAAQTLDIDLYEIREDVKLFVPHMPGNFGPADDPVRVSRQVFDQGIFFGGQLNLVSSSFHTFRAGINFQIGHRDRLRVPSLSTTQKGSTAGQ